MWGLGTYWGFYFAYSPNKTDEEARRSSLSQDLILATQDLGAAMDTAVHGVDTESNRVAMAQRSFYALYLARILVFSRFLDCIPREGDERTARVE